MRDFEIPASFWWELKFVSDSLMENINGTFSLQLNIQSVRVLHHHHHHLFIYSLCHQFQRQRDPSDSTDRQSQEETHTV